MEARRKRRGAVSRQRVAVRARGAAAPAAVPPATADVLPINRQQQRRMRTEQRLVEAFGRIVARDGLYNVRVNELAREAGVGKRQLYQYFGGLAGVAAAWSSAGMQVPGRRSVTPVPAVAPPPGSAAARLATVLLDYAEKLRANPAAVAAVHGQLGGPSGLDAAFREVRAALRKEQLDAFLGDPRLREPRYVALYSVMYAAVNYVVLRQRFAPAFNGLDLRTDEGWNDLMGMFSAVAAVFELGARRGRPKRSRQGDGAGPRSAGP